MANIFTTIQKEIEKGNTLIDKKGNFVNLEKAETIAKKSYLADLKSGVIGFDKSFQDYWNDMQEKGYANANAFVNEIKYMIGVSEETPEMPAPCTPNDSCEEMVAQ